MRSTNPLIINENKRTIDPGEKVIATMSGWQSYSTESKVPENKAPAIVSGPEIMERLNELQKVISPSMVEYLHRLISTHMANKDNPHGVDLKKFVEDIMKLLYSTYHEKGYPGSFEYFKTEFFKLYQLASVSDLTTPVSETVLITLDAIKKFIEHHDDDINAHGAMFERLTPGKPPRVYPTLAISSLLGVASSFQRTTDKEDDRWTFIDRDGYMYVKDHNYLPIDYRFGEPMIPIFETRTNKIAYSNDLEKPGCHLRHVRVARTDAEGVRRDKKTGIEIIEKKDFVPSEHQVVFNDLEITDNVPFSFSFYYKPIKGKLIDIKLIEQGLLAGEASFHYNVERLDSFVSASTDNFGELRCEVIKLPSDIYLLSFTGISNVARLVNIEITIYKSREEGTTYLGNGSTLGIFNYFQFEDGDGPSPTIITHGETKTRTAIPVTVGFKDENSGSYWMNDKEGTYCMQYRAPINYRDGKHNTLYTTRVDLKPVVTARHEHGTVLTLSIFNPDTSEEIFNYPLDSTIDRIKSMAHSHGIMKQMVATSRNRPQLASSTDVCNYDATHLDIGHDRGDNFLNGYLKLFCYYPKALDFDEISFAVCDY